MKNLNQIIYFFQSKKSKNFYFKIQIEKYYYKRKYLMNEKYCENPNKWQRKIKRKQNI
jgi:hypothetical protein